MKRYLKINRLTCLIAGVLALGAGYLPCASAISIQQAYEAALANDPTFLSAVQDANAGKEYAVLGRTSLLPQVSANYGASKIRADLSVPNILGTTSTTHPVYLSHSSTVQLRQTLFSMESLARYKQGIAQTKYSDQQYDIRLQEMILRVCGAYLDALFSSENVALAQAQRDVYIEQQKVNTRLFEKGEGTKTDMLETQSRLDLAEAQVLESLDNQQVALANLAALVGGNVDSLSQLRDGFRVAPMPEGGFDALKQFALDRNPEIQAQLTAIEVARQEVSKSRSGHLPRIDFVASYTKSNADTLNTYNQDSTQRAIGVQVNIPLYSGGSVNAQSRQAVANLEKSRVDLQARKDKILIELKKDYSAVVSSSARIAALDKAVASAKLLIVSTQQSILGGVRINLDLLNARQQLFTAQRDLAQARYGYLNNLLKMRAAAGIIGPDDVREIASYFN